MDAPFRTPEELAASAALPGAVRTGGRVLATSGHELRLWGATTALTVRLDEASEPPPPYALVEVTGRWTGDGLLASALRVVGRPLRGAPTSDGDLFFLAADGGRRARALHQRSAALRAIRRWFDDQGFVEVDTPTMVPSPGLDPHLGAFEVRGRGYLTTSPEYQMKRLLSAGFARIYQLGKSYRDDELGPNHEPEFALLEWYRAFAGADEVMADTEAMVAAVAEALLGTTRLPARGGQVAERCARATRPARIDVAPPWERLTVADAYRRYAGVSLDAMLPGLAEGRAEDEERFFRLMVEVVQPALGTERPVFLTRWPAPMASLARLCPDDPRYAERFEAYADGIELCNGFGELTSATEQRARLERDQAVRAAAGLPVYPIDERFLGALEDGMPPAGGNALGVDRLVLLLVGATALEDVVFVPSRRL